MSITYDDHLYDYFKDMWESKKPKEKVRNSISWNDIGKEWSNRIETDVVYIERINERVNTVTSQLINRDVINKNSTVLDVGCGLGIFVFEFAKISEKAYGIDVSSVMIEYAKGQSLQRNITNTNFSVCDFTNTDIDEMKWENKFDLVMASLTPAISCVEDLHKLMKVSKKYCLHASFVKTYDSLEQRILKELFNCTKKSSKHKNGRVFYSVFNLLFLEGYRPETFYHPRSTTYEIEPNLETATLYAFYLNRNEKEDIEKILNYLQKVYNDEKNILCTREECYGFILWDKTDKSIY